MPSSPHRCKDKEEADLSSNNSIKSASESSTETDKKPSPKASETEKNAMLDIDVMGETRLMLSRGACSDLQTTRDPTVSMSQRLIMTNQKTGHVNKNQSERRCDITNDNTAEGESAQRIESNLAAQPSGNSVPTTRATEEQLQSLSHPPQIHAPHAKTAESATPSTPTRPTPHGPEELDSIVKSTIREAVHSVAASTTSSAAVFKKGRISLISPLLPKKVLPPAIRTPSDNNSTKKTMSVEKLIPAKKPRRKRTPQVKPGQSTGRWTDAEHRAFLDGLKECGREWKKVAMRIPTRTSAQIRSHAQKYFAKLQRDHEAMSMSESHSSHTAAAIPVEGHGEMNPSVQRNVDRILANPQAAQQEVEDTLSALRERYRQLQLRLQQRQQRRLNGGRIPSMDDDNFRSSSPRKRSLAEVADNHRYIAPNDDQSSVASNVSTSVASIASSITASRDLDNGELIALHVLGGGLPRGDSSTEGVGHENAEVKSSEASIATNEGMEVENNSETATTTKNVDKEDA